MSQQRDGLSTKSISSTYRVTSVGAFFVMKQDVSGAQHVEIRCRFTLLANLQTWRV